MAQTLDAAVASMDRWRATYICELYLSRGEPLESIEQLLAAGTPPEHVHLLIGPTRSGRTSSRAAESPPKRKED